MKYMYKARTITDFFQMSEALQSDPCLSPSFKVVTDCDIQHQTFPLADEHLWCYPPSQNPGYTHVLCCELGVSDINYSP